MSRSVVYKTYILDVHFGLLGEQAPPDSPEDFLKALLDARADGGHHRVDLGFRHRLRERWRQLYARAKRLIKPCFHAINH